MIFCTATIPAHPHVCGEHSRKISDIPQLCGSSPRVWGAPLLSVLRTSLIRLIPTCVGSTRLRRTRHNARTAHPHVCGEHLASPAGRLLTTGSSPRVWGALMRRIVQARLVGLIPTCVGSTPTLHRGAGGSAAHPHVCGEHFH